IAPQPAAASAIATSRRGWTASFAAAPISARKSSASVYAPASTWGPLSTSSPVRGSSNEYARPPRKGRASRSVTRTPARASRTAAASPANPPPTTTMWLTRAGEEAEMRPHPRRHREPRLLRPREPHLRSEDVVAPEHHSSQHLLVDEPHRLGGRERAAVLLGEREARPPVVFPGTRALEGHHPAEGLGAAAGEHVGLGAAEATEVLLRQVDAAARGVLGDVAQDVGELEGQPEVHRIVARRGVRVAEDLDAHEPHRARHVAAVTLEVVLPSRVAVADEVHLDPGDHGLEVLPGDRKARDGIGAGAPRRRPPARRASGRARGRDRARRRPRRPGRRRRGKTRRPRRARGGAR